MLQHAFNVLLDTAHPVKPTGWAYSFLPIRPAQKSRFLKLTINKKRAFPQLTKLTEKITYTEPGVYGFQAVEDFLRAHIKIKVLILSHSKGGAVPIFSAVE